MMKAMIDFFKTMLRLPKPWVMWLGLLMFVNMVMPLVYIRTLEGKVVLAAMMAGALLMTMIFKAKGFVRLLGIGHMFWIPLVVWLGTRLTTLAPDDGFQLWILSVIGLNTLSLVIDCADVYRYLKGERAPTLTLDT